MLARVAGAARLWLATLHDKAKSKVAVSERDKRDDDDVGSENSCDECGEEYIVCLS